MKKYKYVCLAVAAAAIVALSSCNGTSTQTTENPSPAPVTNTSSQKTEGVSHSGHGGKKQININNAILSELDKFEAQLGVPALSHKIQANRPYANPEDLVAKKLSVKSNLTK